MKKFVFIYNGKVRPEDVGMEHTKEVMDKWMAWFGTFKDQMVDGGNPFAAGAKSVTAKGTETIPANMWPAKGYTIINAKECLDLNWIFAGNWILCVIFQRRK